ncbi:MAG TPA: hypothetical protein VHS03_09350 [Gaiellaceae bacterium]|jgi:hypothetical protein|nr:hypothetical protein [Gaiellaceae bacterium]
MTSQNLIRLKLLAALVALGCGIGAVVTVYELYQATPAATSVPPASPAAAPAPAPPAASPLALDSTSTPTPPPGALVLGGEAHDLAVGLAVTRQGGKTRLQASVLGGEQPVRDPSVAFAVDGRRLKASACGSGCFAASTASTPRKVRVTVTGSGRAPAAVDFSLPSAVPGPSATAFVARVERSWRSLHTLVDHDRLSSGPGTAIETLWRFQAPSRYTYSITKGPAAVSIGPRRWDKLPGHAWQRSAQDPIAEPIPLWVSVTNAHLLGSATRRGRIVQVASFFDPALHAWFTIWVEPRTMRTLELRMTAREHFMHDVYGGFDAPLRIVPPRRGA